MMPPSPRSLLSASVASLLLAVSASAADKVTYVDHVLPVFKNACLNCHNPDKKKAGLDLSTYQATLAGSDNGKILESGNPSSSLLVKCVRQTEDPKMPPKGDKLTDAEIAILEKWIAGQLLETVNGKAVTTSNNVQVAVVSLTKPDGPPPMPVGDLPLEPLVRSKTQNALVALAASPWAPLVAVGGQKQVILYNTETLQTLGILPFPEGFPAVLRFSRNGQLLLTGGGLGGKSGKVVLWKVESGERAGQVGDEFDQVLGADLSPDQAHVALGGPTKILKIYSTGDGKLEHSLKKHTDWITSVAFSPDGQFLASADRSGGIVVWEGATGKEYISLPGHKLAVTALAFMPGVLASASEDGKITLWNVKEGKEIRSWAAHAGGVESVDFTPDGRVVSSGRDKLAKVWDQNGKVLGGSSEFGDIALRAVLSQERLVAGDWTGQIRVINFADKKSLGELTSNPPPISDNLAAAEKRLADAKAKLAALPEPGAAAPAPAPEAPKAVAEAKPAERADIAALEKQRVDAQAAVDAEKAAKAGPDATKLAMLRKKRDEIVELIAQAQKRPAPAATPAPEPAKADGRAAAEAEVAAATADLQHWQRAQAFMSVHRAKQTLADLTAKLEILKAAVQEGLAPIDRLKEDTAAAEKAAGTTATAAKTAEEELAKVRSEATAAKKSLADADATVKDKTEQKKAAVAAAERAAGEVSTVTASLEAKRKEVAALTKAANALAAGSPERGAADAKLTAPSNELTKLQTQADAAAEALKSGHSAVEARSAEMAAAETALKQAKAAAAAADDKIATATKALADLQKKAKAAADKLADLRTNAPKMIAEIKAAKAQAEKDLTTTTKELETAKAQAEKARAEYEARYRPAGSPQPIASAAKP